MASSETVALRQEVARLHRKLQGSEDTIQAIQEGRVDAFVMARNAAERVYTLECGVRPYRILVERMQQCAVAVAPDSTILYVNCQSSSLLGRKPEQLVGTSFNSIVNDVDRSQFEALVKGANDVAAQGEIRLKKADGTLVPVYLSANALMAGEGSGVCLLITDLTRQKQYEELIVAENLARSMLEQAADAVVVCDPEGIVAFACPAAHQLCGQNPLGQPFHKLFPLSVPAKLACAPEGRFDLKRLEEAIRGLEVSLLAGDTGARSLLLSAGPVRDRNQELLGFVVTLVDIGVLKRAEHKLREADRRKDEFLAVLAHELRNPLAPIVTGLDVIRLAGDDAEKSARALRMITRQVEHLTRLVDDLLEISRITMGKIALQKEVLDFEDVLNNALDSTRHHLDTSGLSIRIDLPPAPIRLEVDGVRLSQVIINLLNNAITYSQSGSEIRLSARVADKDVEIRVLDSGRGIEPELLDEIFTMFTQPRSSRRRHDGLGVGLALVRRIVELHGGSVHATSPGVGHGSEFTVRLPIGDVTGRKAPAG